MEWRVEQAMERGDETIYEVEGIVGRTWAPYPSLAHVYFFALVSILKKSITDLFSKKKKKILLKTALKGSHHN